MKIDTIEMNGSFYYIANKLFFNNYEYLFLINEQDKNDIIVRKKYIENSEEYIVGLDNEIEFEMIMKEYFERFNK